MRAFKKILALAAVLAIGALAFADEAASNYITKFTSLVTTAETCAKNNDGSKIAELEANKVQIDALRKTVTLSLTQRFSDWRLNQRYDSACQKIKAAQKSSTAAASAKDSANKIGAALNDAANQVGGALKETGTQAANNVKESVNTAANSVKDTAKTKVDETVTETTNSITGKIQEGAAAITNALNNLLGGKKSSDD